jgi:hypothetical protein
VDLDNIRIAGCRTQACRFSHPSAVPPFGWGSKLTGEYLVDRLGPTLALAVNRV